MDADLAFRTAALDAAPAAAPGARRWPALDPAMVEGAALVLCDLDGCLVSEGRAFADAAGFVDLCGARLRIVSNRSDLDADACAAALAGQGLAVPAAHLWLAGEATLRHLAEALPRGARLRLLAPPPLAARAAALGLSLARPGEGPVPAATLLCRDPAAGVEELGEVLADVAGGAELWISNLDLSHPAHDGSPVPETGALLAALRAIRPGLSFRSLGKPHPHLLTAALAEAGVAPADAVFVGDNPDTDGRAALAAGVRFVHLDRSLAR
ncbi:HAD hydrolase-like protein [Albimonas sp. CAU 1670]|uniref:HAD hydrolase-like protein n=1 Tax=Albimonas sp. CAU 1670 TaxID=3032599 RepID=UPI0023DAD513|nr:HAD hydrolase-like protein [Albimonas sp. CAU 1670]MDF2234761.1 HAD hydrolase-like protein [Albimonas sp. CAU 1670]